MHLVDSKQKLLCRTHTEAQLLPRSLFSYAYGLEDIRRGKIEGRNFSESMKWGGRPTRAAAGRSPPASRGEERGTLASQAALPRAARLPSPRLRDGERDA